MERWGRETRREEMHCWPHRMGAAAPNRSAEHLFQHGWQTCQKLTEWSNVQSHSATQPSRSCVHDWGDPEQLINPEVEGRTWNNLLGMWPYGELIMWGKTLLMEIWSQLERGLYKVITSKAIKHYRTIKHRSNFPFSAIGRDNICFA